MKKRSVAAIVAAIVLVATLCVAMTGCRGCGTNTYTVTMSTATAETYSDYTDMIAGIRPSVVEVYAEGYAQENGQTVLGAFAGAGVIIGKDDDGYHIVTNQHVVEDCFDIQVKVLSIPENGDESTTTYEAEFIGGSHERDIAVLRIETNDELQTATWMENSDELKVGSEVVAIGNPTGTLGGTVTRGIVSATSRKINVENIGSMDLIQMDAAINSGNSGGGLFYTRENGDGSWSAYLAGIVNSGATGYDGLGFAIPADDAKYAVNSLIQTYNTDETVYGYVPGDASLTITAASETAYVTDDGSSLNGNRETIVYASDVQSSDLDALNTDTEYAYNTASSYHAIRSIKVTDSETKEVTSVTVTSMSDIDTAFDAASAGDKLEIVVSDVKIEQIRSGFRIFYAPVVESETSTITVDSLSQYRYTPPSAPTVTV